jgi:hypothetical protein
MMSEGWWRQWWDERPLAPFGTVNTARKLREVVGTLYSVEIKVRQDGTQVARVGGESETFDGAMSAALEAARADAALDALDTADHQLMAAARFEDRSASGDAAAAGGIIGGPGGEKLEDHAADLQVSEEVVK